VKGYSIVLLCHDVYGSFSPVLTMGCYFPSYPYRHGGHEAGTSMEPRRAIQSCFRTTRYTQLHRISQVINEPGASGGPPGGSNNSKDSGRGSQPEHHFLAKWDRSPSSRNASQIPTGHGRTDSNTIHIVEYLNTQSDKMENKAKSPWSCIRSFSNW